MSRVPGNLICTSNANSYDDCIFHSEEHPLDGGAVPPRVVRVDPFFIDTAPVTNKEYGNFVRATYYETEAEKFGWSFVLSSFLPNATSLETAEVDPGAEDWVATDKAYWRNPEGPGTSYKVRDYPVTSITLVHQTNSTIFSVSGKSPSSPCFSQGRRGVLQVGWKEIAGRTRVGGRGASRTLWTKQSYLVCLGRRAKCQCGKGICKFMGRGLISMGKSS